MARFFVGWVSSLWNVAGNWSNVSGGPGGFSVPTVSNVQDVYFDANSPSCDFNIVDLVVNIFDSSAHPVGRYINMHGYSLTARSHVTLSPVATFVASSNVAIGGAALSQVDFGHQTLSSLTVNKAGIEVQFTDYFTVSGEFTAYKNQIMKFKDGTALPFSFADLVWQGYDTAPIVIDTISGAGTCKFNITGAADKVYYANVKNCDASFGSAITDYQGADNTGNTNWVFIQHGAPTTVARSVGTHVPYSIGLVTVVDSTHLTLSGGLWSSRWGEGDKITIDGEIRYVLSRLDATHIVLQTATTKTGSGLSYAISRCYSSPESACIAEARDLIAANEQCKIVLYKDTTYGRINFGLRQGTLGPFFGEQPWISDVFRYVHVTAAVQDRHNGRAGSGVAMSISGFSAIYIQRLAYVEISWLELKNSGSGVTAYSDYSSVHHCIIHDMADKGTHQHDASGAVYAKCYRNLIYNCNTGIFSGAPTSTLEYHSVYCNTVYNCANTGILNFGPSRGVCYKNNISLGNLKNYFFGVSPIIPIWNAASSNNMGSAADLAAGLIPGTAKAVSTAAVEFRSVVSGSEDLRITAVAVAREIGLVIPLLYYNYDIDDTLLSPSILWDIGADQYGIDISVGTIVAVLQTISGEEEPAIVGFIPESQIHRFMFNPVNATPRFVVNRGYALDDGDLDRLRDLPERAVGQTMLGLMKYPGIVNRVDI